MTQTMNKLITCAAECSVRRFEDCMFKGRLEVLVIGGEPTREELLVAWNGIRTEFMDLSGASSSRELELMVSINITAARINRVNLTLFLHRSALKELRLPFLPALDDLLRYGYRFRWNPDNDRDAEIEAFMLQMDQVEAREAFQQASLEGDQRALADLQASNKQTGEGDPEEARINFLRAINSLEKSGHHIDEDRMMVDRLAVMFATIREENEQAQVEKLNPTKR